jgi:hypothetical protein
VNGSWLSSDIGLRIADAAAKVKARAPGKPTFLTFFWQINTDSVAYSMFTWANANLPASTRANIDVVTFSKYQEQAPMGVAFDQVMKTLRDKILSGAPTTTPSPTPSATPAPALGGIVFNGSWSAMAKIP